MEGLQISGVIWRQEVSPVGARLLSMNQAVSPVRGLLVMSQEISPVRGLLVMSQELSPAVNWSVGVTGSGMKRQKVSPASCPYGVVPIS